MHNCFICLNILRCFNSDYLSAFEKLNYKLNESYIINEMKKIINKKHKYENGYKYRYYGVLTEDF